MSGTEDRSLDDLFDSDLDNELFGDGDEDTEGDSDEASGNQATKEADSDDINWDESLGDSDLDDPELDEALMGEDDEGNEISDSEVEGTGTDVEFDSDENLEGFKGLGDDSEEFDKLDDEDLSSLSTEEINRRLQEQLGNLGEQPGLDSDIQDSEFDTLDTPIDTDEEQPSSLDNDALGDDGFAGFEGLETANKHPDEPEVALNPDADHDGSIITGDTLMEDYETVDKDRGFFSEDGNIFVMDDIENKENFRFQYIDIEKIAIVQRIRKNTTNVDDLVQSIKSTGLLEPLVVAETSTEGIYVLLAGFRRILACAKAGKRRIPCIVNLKANTPEIPVLEAIYNHSRKYTIKEIVDYIDYLEKEKGIMSASMIEYLLQLNSGDYTKLKDILTDNDDDIVSKLFDGTYNIETAFKKLEQRRKKESAEEKENKKAARVYDDEEESGASKIAGSGDESSEDAALSDEEIASLAINVSDLSNVDEMSLDDMVEESKKMEGFEPHKQTPGEREIIDPAIRKAVMSRDNNTCQCCLRGGPDYVDILDLHHIVEVYLGGEDSVENSVALCLNCHKQVHLFAFNKLHIPPSKSGNELEAEVKSLIAQQNAKNAKEGKPNLSSSEEDEIRQQYLATYKEEQNKYKRIVVLGNVIRKGLQMKGMKLEDAKKEHPIDKIGRQMPGQKNTIA